MMLFINILVLTFIFATLIRGVNIAFHAMKD